MMRFIGTDKHKGFSVFKCDKCGEEQEVDYSTNANSVICACAMQMFNALVFIGRFQPLHKGHEAIISEALKQAREVVVVVGSSFEARSIRNPFSFEERRDMIRAVFPQNNLHIVPVLDYPYDDNKWVAAVQSAVHAAVPNAKNIGLIGHSKDHTSFYLNIFPMWGSVSVPNINSINATDIREKFLEDGAIAYKRIDENTWVFLSNFYNTTEYKLLNTEYLMIKQYKESWKAAPFPPTFMTVDALVVQSGHILVVKRGAMPGKGLWALPGGFLNQNETMLEGALRELKEETKIKVPLPVLRGSIKESKTFDAPNRSQRGRTITQAFYIDLGVGELPKVRGSDDASHAVWMPLSEVVEQKHCFFEDHAHIIDYFCNIL
jgi:bifunctional NMN adenylyltransferase/nudix hydrolase